MDQWFAFYSASNLLEAKLLQGMLIKLGIESRLEGEFSMAAVGELPVDCFQVTLVATLTNWERAKQAVIDYEKDSQQEWFCKHCGESNPGSFEYCWACHDHETTKCAI